MLSATRLTVKGNVMKNVLTALTYIDNAYAILKTALKNEKIDSISYLTELYEYGLSDAQLHLVKLANIKKSISSITGNRTYKQVEDQESDE